MNRRKYSSNLIWGIILILLGLLFLLENLGLDIFDDVWKFWPVVLIIWGWSKFKSGLKSHREAGKAEPEGYEEPPRT